MKPITLTEKRLAAFKDQILLVLADYRAMESERAYVYEMGIPVEECDSPVSIDVGQRVILRERRDTLTESYRRMLFASVLSARIDKVPDEELRSQASLVAMGDFYTLSTRAKERITQVYTSGLPYAASTKARQEATGHHVECLNLSVMPEPVRAIVKAMGTNVTDVMESRRAEFCPEVSPMTEAQQRLVSFWEWVARGIHRPCHVKLCLGSPALADFGREERVLTVYVDAVGKGFFRDPSSPEALSLLGHELAHWQAKPDELEHGTQFHADCDDVGGLMASFLLKSAEQARLLLTNSLVERGTSEGA
jgi:hypothetical protein